MKDKDQHPDRTDMLKAIESGVVPFESHLTNCKSCRQMYELLSTFGQAGCPSLIHSSSEGLGRHAAIGRRAEIDRPERSIVGCLVSDSWTQLAPAQVRDATVGLERRLCLRADNITLELVAERLDEKWQFVARVYKEEEATSEFVLKVGTRKLVSQAEGFFHWSSSKPPQTLRLLSESLQINFEKVSWLSAMTS